MPQKKLPPTPAAKSTRSDTKTRQQVRQAAAAAASKKALDVVALDVRKLADFCDYFLICHGANPAQIEAIAEAIELQLEQKQQLRPVHREGVRRGEWIVLDYLHFIVHVFSAKTRRFYDLERLWSGAQTLSLEAALRAGKPKPDKV